MGRRALGGELGRAHSWAARRPTRRDRPAPSAAQRPAPNRPLARPLERRPKPARPPFVTHRKSIAVLSYQLCASRKHSRPVQVDSDLGRSVRFCPPLPCSASQLPKKACFSDPPFRPHSALAAGDPGPRLQPPPRTVWLIWSRPLIVRVKAAIQFQTLLLLTKSSFSLSVPKLIS